MEIKKTITSIFMVPTLQIPKDELKNNGFINGYNKDATADVEYKNAIYLLFKPTDLDKFRLFIENERERTKSIIDDYDYNDGYVVVVYQLNSKFKDDFDLIRRGKYSKTSFKFQELFPKVVKIMKNGLHKDEISLQFRVFNRTQDLVDFWEKKFNLTFGEDQEVWNGFFEEEEILNLDKIKEHV
jgi:hypothetical protein